MKNKGFSIIETVIVLFIIGLSVFGLTLLRYHSIYAVDDTVSKVTSFLKYGQIVAMQKTTNVGFCFSNNSLTVYDIGLDRDASPCSGSIILSIPSHHRISISSSHSFSIDPRGLMITPIQYAMVVISDGSHGYGYSIQIYKTLASIVTRLKA